MRMTGGITVTGLGMVSAIGMDVVASCAAARAGVTRLAPLELEESDIDALETVPLRGHPVLSLTDGFDGLARLLRLSKAALADLVRQSGLQAEHLARTGFLLNTPGELHSRAHMGLSPPSTREDEGEEVSEEEALAEMRQARLNHQQRLLEGLLKPYRSMIPARATACFAGGAATFISALDQAVEWLHSRLLDRCIVGGVDSLVSRTSLERVYELGLLRGVATPTGFFPGEASAFILLERVDSASARGAPIQAFLGPYSTAAETFHRFSGIPPTGEALFRTIHGCLSSQPLNARALELAILNLNGDEFRARDFGMALVRAAGMGLPTSFRQWYPPEHFGEIGAATGAASICLGVRGFARGYARSPEILIALLDDDENRGALLVTAPPSHSNQPSGMP